jgi:hypothetical protein
MGERNPAEGPIAKRVARGRLSIQSKKEAGFWIDKRMAKTIQHDPRGTPNYAIPSVGEGLLVRFE